MADPDAQTHQAIAVTDSRYRLLREVLRRRDEGATADELSRALGVSRTAVAQQLTALERDGLLEPKGRRATGGRPSRTYALTDAGRESFPRRYALFATSLMRHAFELFGDEGLTSLLERMAEEVAADVAPRLADKVGPERRREVVAALNELGYEATLSDDGTIEAVNCVFSQVARQSPAACRYDVALLGALLGEEVSHDACLAEGHACCRFRPA